MHHDTHSTDTTHIAHTQRAPAARPVGGQSGEGQRLTSDAPQDGGRHPPRGRPSATPTASNAGPQGRTLWGWCWVPTPTPIAPGTHGTRNPGCPLHTYDFSSCFFPKFKIMHFQNRDIKLYTVVLLFLCFLKFLLKLCCR